MTTQVAKGGGIAFIGQLCGKFFSLLLQVLLTRVLGLTGYGLYALGFSVLGIAQTVSTLGLQNGVVRFGAMYKGSGDTPRLKGAILLSLVLSFSFAVVIATLLFLFSGTIARLVFNEPDLIGPLRMFSLALPFYTLVFVTAASARALSRIDYAVTIGNIAGPILILPAVGLSFLLGYRLMGAVAGFASALIVSAGIGIYLLSRLFPELISKLRPRYEPRILVPYSLTVLLVGLCHVLITGTDRIMLGMLGSAEEVGIYNAAAMLSIQATLFLTSFNAIFSPLIAHLFHQRRKDDLATLFKTMTKWIFTLSFPIVWILVLFANPLMNLFGAEFSVGAAVLIVLAVAQLINTGVGSVGYMLTMTGRHKLELMNSLSLGGLNVCLNIILIPRYSVLGAAVATGISIALINIIRLIEVYSIYKMHPYKPSYWKPAVAGISAALSWLGLNSILGPNGYFWIGGIAVFVVVYAMLLALLGLDNEDRLILRTFKIRILGQLGRLKK